MAKATQAQPVWQVDFRYDGTRRVGRDGRSYVDYDSPIDSTLDFSSEEGARERAAKVSELGGRAAIVRVDPDTGHRRVVLELAPATASGAVMAEPIPSPFMI